MIPDAECVRIISEILSELQLGKFLVKVRMASITKLYSLHTYSLVYSAIATISV